MDAETAALGGEAIDVGGDAGVVDYAVCSVCQGIILDSLSEGLCVVNISKRPKSFTAEATRASIWASSRTSVITKLAFPPWPIINSCVGIGNSFLVSPRALGWMSAQTIVAPSWE